MGHDCHRCGAALGTPDTFCPNCGAPQLRFAAEAESAENGAANTPAVRPQDLAWKHAVGAAMIVALPVGLLSSSLIPVLSDGCCLWVIGGGIAAVGLYRHRSAGIPVDGKTGLRIGTVIGILAASLATAVNGVVMLFQRYVLHTGDAMEKAFQASMEQGSVMASQFYHVSPAQAHQSIQFWISPDGRAAAVLLTAAMASVGIVIFSAIGGVLGARIFSGRNRALRDS